MQELEKRQYDMGQLQPTLRNVLMLGLYNAVEAMNWMAPGKDTETDLGKIVNVGYTLDVKLHAKPDCVVLMAYLYAECPQAYEHHHGPRMVVTVNAGKEGWVVTEQGFGPYPSGPMVIENNWASLADQPDPDDDAAEDADGFGTGYNWQQLDLATKYIDCALGTQILPDWVYPS